MFEQAKMFGVTIRQAIPQVSLLPLSTSVPVIIATPLPSRLTMIFVQRAFGNSSSVSDTLITQIFVPLSATLITDVTLFVPTGKVDPLGGVEVILVIVHPFTTGNPYITLLLLHCPASALATISPGQLILRQIVSTTTWSINDPFVPPVNITVSAPGHGGPNFHVVSSTTHCPPNPVVSTVCCCSPTNVPPAIATVALVSYSVSRYCVTCTRTYLYAPAGDHGALDIPKLIVPNRPKSHIPCRHPKNGSESIYPELNGPATMLPNGTP